MGVSLVLPCFPSLSLFVLFIHCHYLHKPPFRKENKRCNDETHGNESDKSESDSLTLVMSGSVFQSQQGVKGTDMTDSSSDA